MSNFAAVTEQGQSIWFDYIQRGMIWDGRLHRMVLEDSLRGVTSNPAIFNAAIGKGTEYGPALRAAARDGADATRIFERLAITDIQLAADVLRPVYERTKALDGYVSLEVSPHLAHDTAGTLADARRLWGEVCRENVMIKIPATPAGLPAIEQAIADGININVTLLFAVEAYEAVAQAYLSGLEKRAAAGQDVSRVASVASFFVSRIDGLVDSKLAERKNTALLGKVAIANAKIAYQSFLALEKTERWRALLAKNARPQRLLWASTSTKNPAFRDVIYVEELIGPNTVNTIPEATFDAFKDHGICQPKLTEDVDGARRVMAELAAADISMKAITDALLEDGVKKFQVAFDELIATVEKRRAAL